MTKGGNLLHDSTIRREKQRFDEPDEKNDDATSVRDHKGENKTEERRILPAEGHICG